MHDLKDLYIVLNMKKTQKSYSDIFEQIEQINETKESFVFESEKEINSNDQAAKREDNFPEKKEEDNRHEKYCEDYNEDKKKISSINETETKENNKKHKETVFLNEEYEKQLSETNKKNNDFNEKKYIHISGNIIDIKEIILSTKTKILAECKMKRKSMNLKI